MKWNFVVLSEEGRKTPHGVVIHAIGERPEWTTTSKRGNTLFELLFTRESVFANVPSEDNGDYLRVEKTYADPDYLEYASVKVDLPLYVISKGSWDTNVTDKTEVLKSLATRFLEKDNE